MPEFEELVVDLRPPHPRELLPLPLGVQLLHRHRVVGPTLQQPVRDTYKVTRKMCLTKVGVTAAL